ncbi:ankyrin [Trichoderma longibrachiatum ATCC 18648]|uniref:Ankyrin n=1 Tax=Trichoderma longibrachiatum ATCC 18648 TaxID=983965 RepID=A0A2T4C733_TRILO|nr:ankyrin [Trichoderma longibrachiatum ATCC 18648]
MEDDGNFPSTQQAGPKTYWAPVNRPQHELHACVGQITSWSTKSDVWAAGAVVYWILTGQAPVQDPVKGQLMNSGSILQFLAGSKDDPTSLSTSLGRLVIECLDSSPDARPSALELLAVAVKADTSELSSYKSGSFWKALSMHTNREVVSTVTKHFVSTHLPILARSQTVFDPEEVAIIISLAKAYCPENLLEDEEIIRLAVTDSKWPETEEFMHLALQKDNLGLLPSALAASKQNLPLCASLTSIEDRCRAAISDQLLQNKINSLHSQHEEELGIVLEQLATGSGGQLDIPASHAATMMIGSASRGSSYVVRKLVEFGIQPSVQDGARSSTVLHIFSARGNLPIISFLLDHGADIEARDRNHRTPLHQAASYVVRFLLTVGADKSLRGGSHNRTPLEVAISTEQVDVYKMLEDDNGK